MTFIYFGKFNEAERIVRKDQILSIEMEYKTNNWYHTTVKMIDGTVFVIDIGSDSRKIILEAMCDIIHNK